MKSGSDISMKPDADMVMRKLAQNPSFCGLQKLNSLNLHPFFLHRIHVDIFLLFKVQVIDIKRLANSIIEKSLKFLGIHDDILLVLRLQNYVFTF